MLVAKHKWQENNLCSEEDVEGEGTGVREQLRMAAIDQELSQFSALLMQSSLNGSWVWKLWMRQSSPETISECFLFSAGDQYFIDKITWKNVTI